MQGLEKTIRVTVRFDDAAGLVPDSAIKVAGVTVGALERIVVDHNQAIATLKLRRSANIRSDVRAEIRARSLLGEKYLALYPQTRDATLLVDGDTIENVRQTMELDQVVASFGPLVADVSPNDVATIVSSLAAIVKAMEDDVPEAVSASKRLILRLEELGDLVPGLKSEVPALTADLRRLAASVEATMKKADALVDQLSKIAAEVDVALDDVPDVVASAKRITTDLEPGMDDLARALERSDELAAKLEVVLGRLEDLDEAALRRLLREEGVLVRLKPLSQSEKEKWPPPPFRP
jgi:phospholipid/cholesterol/gamma-HCH transport system substrate-binding protein